MSLVCYCWLIQKLSDLNFNLLKESECYSMQLQKKKDKVISLL